MTKEKMSLLLLPAVAFLSACINDDYDLSDIDSTVELTVEGLVLPINIDEITLDAVLDVDDNSRIKNINGEYAVVEDGTFASSPIHVSSFTTKAPSINPITDDLSVNYSLGTLSAGSVIIDSDQLILSYDISDEKTEIDIEADDVDESIISVEHIGIKDGAISVSLTFEGLSEIADKINVEDLQLKLIKGLDADFSIGTYSEETGIVEIGDISCDDYSITLEIGVTGIGSASGMQIDDSRKFSFSDECYVVAGKITIYASDIKSEYYDSDGSLNLSALSEEIPDYVVFTCTPDVSSLEVEDFSGQVKYDIDGIEIDPVEMNDLPSLLSQSGTNINLENPQIYLQLNNPVYEYGLYATAGLQITSDNGQASADYSLDEPLTIDESDNKYCLSPSDPETYYSGTLSSDGSSVDFSDCSHETFSTLGSVLSGDGLPDSLEIYVVDPQIPEQEVTDFKLGTDLDAVSGVYVFYAPLDLTSDSKIKYTDTIDGWNDDDVDAITITKLVVDADLSTDIPLSLEICAYPVDTDGNKITNDGNEVVGTVNKTISYGTDEPIEITVSGTITHLDGIIIEASITGTEESEESLQPDQTITVKNIKATISGTYEKEL